jgi:hypothetical protein
LNVAGLARCKDAGRTLSASLIGNWNLMRLQAVLQIRAAGHINPKL